MSTSSSGAPGPVARRLFFTDFEGQPAEPEDVFADGLDGGWQQREPEAIALLRDRAAHPYDRFLACAALAAWGSPVGYQAVIDEAADPESVVWRDQSADRRFGVDDTFALLAEDVGRSVDIAEQRGTTAGRRAAQAALLGLAARYFFDRRLVQGMYDPDVRALATELDAAIESGIARLRRNERVAFDLATQIAGLIDALARVDPDRARARRRTAGHRATRSRRPRTGQAGLGRRLAVLSTDVGNNTKRMILNGWGPSSAIATRCTATGRLCSGYSHHWPSR